MGVRSKRLFGPVALVGGVTTVVYTCPSGETALIKHVALLNAQVLNNGVNFFINGTTFAQAIAGYPVPGNSHIQATGLFWVLHPGDVLRAVSNAQATTVTGFGAELEGAAD